MENKTIKGKFEGYLWKSDNDAPILFDGKEYKEIAFDNSVNPFVVEGELYDAENGLSYTVRFVDGKYIIECHQVTKADIAGNEHITKKEYLAQRMQGVSALKYLQYWKIVNDELCEGMETLQPDDLVFVGFKKESE